MRVQFKFDERAAEADRNRLLEELQQQGASSVEPLFPGETEASLSALYTADYPADVDGQQVVSALSSRDAIEFAELEPVRRLIP